MGPAVFLLSILLLQTGDSLDTLLERLRTDDSPSRRQAQLALLRGGAGIVPGLIRSLESASPRPEEEIARLVRRLASAAWKERNEATDALVKLGRAAVPTLEAQLASADPEAAWRIRAAVAEIREKAGQDEQAEELRSGAICDVLGQSGDRRAVAPLLRLLAADPPEKRTSLKVRACQALGLLRPSMDPSQAEEAADRVLQVLERTPAPLDKGTLIQTLGVLGSAEAVRPLAALLADRSEKNVHLKRSCAGALAAIGQARGLHALVDALAADDVYVRQGAASALEGPAGEAFGYDPRATPEENRGALGKLRAWGAAKYGKSLGGLARPGHWRSLRPPCTILAHDLRRHPDVESLDEAIAAMAEARRAGADLCELRIDYLRDPDLAKILASKPLPVLATVRPKWEGGQYDGDEALRFGLLEDACLHGADYVDVEFRAYKDFPRREAKLVVSYHDFEKTPDDLEATAREMAALDPFLVKVACQARGVADLTRLITLQKTFPSPIAVIAMGEVGEPLRVLYHRYGGWLTFASLKAGLESAPGQVTVEELVRLYQAKTIDDATEVYGVVGNPVAHSKSPLVFNDVFKHLGMNARYVKIKVDDPAGLRGLAAALELKGCSVTIPHKQAVAGLVDESDDLVKGVGAANTVTVTDGRLIGANTDLPGAMEAIQDAAVKKWSHGIYGMRALVLGAGGVSRAIAWGLKREAARVVLANRTFDRGKALAEELGVDFVRWESLMDARAQIIVNGTSAGMMPRTEESPVDAALFKKDMVVMDTVYTPRNTKFLRDARAAGALGIDGVEMFLRQANHQFRLWKGRPIPMEILKEFSQKL